MIHSSDISCLMELFLDGIVTFPERETFIKLVGDKLYTSSPISSAVLSKSSYLATCLKVPPTARMWEKLKEKHGALKLHKTQEIQGYKWT